MNENEPTVSGPFYPTTEPKWHAKPWGAKGEILRKKDGTGRAFSTKETALREARRVRYEGDAALLSRRP